MEVVGYASLPTVQILIPGDDLALAAEHARGIEQRADPAAHQKFRTPGADRVLAPTTRSRLA
jgi:hypothetical protein